MSDWVDALTQLSYLIRREGEFTTGLVAGPHYGVARALEVYRNNYRGNLQDALSSAFPVIWQLVGNEFFEFLAHHYIMQYPPVSANLHDYGGEMSSFLANFAPVTHLCYLPDMAGLEWAWQKAYFAADTPLFEVQQLSTVPAELYPALRWHFHPSCTLLICEFPVIALWKAHQPGSTQEFRWDQDTGGEVIIVYRNDLQVKMKSITSATLHWLNLLHSKMPLGIATSSTVEMYPEFNVAENLRLWFEQGVLIGFEITQ